MKNFLSSSFLLSFSLLSCAQMPSEQEQISAAVLSLPENLRQEATVLGHDRSGELITLRQGSNDQICLADDPNKEGYNAACYHKDLSDFMARGRALTKEGKNSGEIFDIREKEAKAGELIMPDHPATLHIYYGPDGKFNTETGEMENTNIRYVVYIPWATPESTGLPLKPMVPGGPWIMNPGTHRAHIMITPPKKEEDKKAE